MDDRGLGGVVGSLHLWEIDDMATHRSSSNKASVSKVGELVSVDVGALLLLSSPVRSSSLGTVEGAI